MTYTKPSIKVLDEAVRVIQGGKHSGNVDGIGLGTPNPDPPAYELDE